MQSGGSSSVTSTKKSWLFIAIVIVVAIGAALVIWWAAMATIQQSVQLAESQQPVVSTKSTATPQLTTEVVVSGRTQIWEVAFLPTKEMVFTERKGVLSIVKNGQPATLRTIEDISAKGEGGLLGLAVDAKFIDNRFIYTCFNSTKGDIRVVRWRVSADLGSLEARTDIVTGIPANPSGRHSGCRVAFGPDGYVWIGTGDTARGDTSIQPKSLGGKTLRVDRDGKPAPGNIGGQYDARIFSYGHRNVQGLAFFPGGARQGVLGISVEHGSSVDDEINVLRPGNFGWAPPAQGYDESVPMTDKTRFPDAIDPIWKSGNPTQAPSGAGFVHGAQWKAWDGRLMVAMLKDKQLKVVNLTDQNKLAGEDHVFQGQFGRLRTAVQGPDGNLYLATDNSSNNQIIRVTPH
ncbi:MAG TPA: PQQ-dependent sugar dehydrogenase [Candidatus Saccharimonadales bacterium]|nr:PQQ-dependent sugar dehydrogenase [Candidatus Saccharimonadales bacterium]